MKKIISTPLLCLLLTSCNHSSSQNYQSQKAVSQSAQGSWGASETGNSKTGKFLKFKPVSLNDPASTGEALTMLVPDGWKMQGRVIWYMDNAYYPATQHIQVTSANGDMQYELFPQACYCISPSFQYGARYMGCTVVGEVPSAVNGIKHYLIPAYRKNVQNLKVVDEKVLSDVQQGITNRQAAVVKVEYNLNGKLYEENIYAIRIASQGRFTRWMLSSCYGFRAPEGKLNASMKLFETMLHSMQINQKWYANEVQMSQILARKGMAEIRNAGERARINAQTADERRQASADAYYKYQKTNEENNDKFCDYLLDVNTYTDPTTHEQYKLPAGYDRAWKSTGGEYIVSDDPSYDPSKYSTQSWTELEQQK